MLKVDSMVNINDDRISKVVKNLESITSNLKVVMETLKPY